jgi:hypothetical protein
VSEERPKKMLAMEPSLFLYNVYLLYIILCITRRRRRFFFSHPPNPSSWVVLFSFLV